MKNNTKLIMETWRRFLKEGTEGIDEDGMVIEMHDEDDPSSLPPVSDSDLEYLGYDEEAGLDGPSPIPPEGLYGAAGDDDYEGDFIDHEAIKYYEEHDIEHDKYGNAIDSYEEEDEEKPETFDGSIDDPSIDDSGY